MYGVKEYNQPFRYYVGGDVNNDTPVMGSATVAARMTREGAIATARAMQRKGWDVAAFQWT